ncbi:MAG: nucleotide exchange factor GrpE [Verrucomicrobiota bacterium]
MSDETDKGIATEHGAGPARGGADELVASDWTHEQVEQWKDQASKAQEHWDRLVRLSADFDNYKKRAVRERQDASRAATESVLQKLLPVLDNLEMALAAAEKTSGNAAEALKTGVAMIHSQFRSVLAEAGLEEIQATGKPFDPNWHEAVAQQASAEVPEGNVLQQIRKGFKLNDRLIRPASVVVAKKPAA